VTIDPAARLESLGLSLPALPSPAGTYVPYAINGLTVALAGHTNERNGVPTAIGRVPSAVSVEEAYGAARVCGLNLLASLRSACDGDLARVERCFHVRGFVNADEGFEAIGRIINGASDLFVAVFGDAGRHARTSIGVATLPNNAAVEVDAVFLLRS
jgi:enamine deaminase RidA (YjgF/YER057c/UK114 family)